VTSYSLHILVDESDFPGYVSLSISNDRYAYGGNIVRTVIPPADVDKFVVDSITSALQLARLKAEAEAAEAAAEEATAAAESAS
jgi:hypothetical protein